MNKYLKISCAIFFAALLIAAVGFTSYQEIDRSGLEEYCPADIDADSSTCYYGFVDMAGEWYILRKSTTSGDDAYRYARGESGYVARWSARESDTTFDYFYNKF